MATVISGDTGIDKITDGSVVQADLASGITVDSLSTASGSAPSYSARAWVNFNGSGTVAIRESGNVSSLIDHGTGDYTVNFTTAMPDATYAWSIGCNTATATTTGYATLKTDASSVPATYTTSAFRILTCESSLGALRDISYICLLFFR